MRAGYASRTAEYNALFRALHSSLPTSRRFFDDPLAQAFLTWPLNLVARLTVVPGWRGFVHWFIDKRWPGMRSSVVARSALIDDWITTIVGDGMEQLVVLGAGYDSRPYRMPCLSDLAVFEVDHPATQSAKQRALRRQFPALTTNVCYVSSNFDEGQLETVMAAAGYRATLATIFLLEGVTNYLSEAAVDTTVRWCSRAAANSVLIFTYVHRDVLTHPGAFVGTGRLFATLAKAGERLTFGLDPKTLPHFLTNRGLHLERDVGAAEYRRLYLKDAARKIRGHEFYRVALARIADYAPPPDLVA
jgi:methyltransferase (TIGR00027 family)